jgi:hypothetical protein
MRPSGGVTPDMINFAHSTDVYKIWADMIAGEFNKEPEGDDYYCAFIGRRDSKNYKYKHTDVLARYGANLRMVQRNAAALAGAMGDMVYLATFKTKEEVDCYYAYMMEAEG